MSIKKDELSYKKEQVVFIDYPFEKLNKCQKNRQGRLAIITNIIEKKIINKFSNDFNYVYRYEVIVGNEKIQIDQCCLISSGT